MIIGINEKTTNDMYAAIAVLRNPARNSRLGHTKKLILTVQNNPIIIPASTYCFLSKVIQAITMIGRMSS